MRADDWIKEQVRPKPEHAECVGVDRTVQQLRQCIVRDAEREKREPHADRVVHVETLHSDLSEPVLVPWNRCRDPEDRREDEAADRVPV